MFKQFAIIISGTENSISHIYIYSKMMMMMIRIATTNDDDRFSWKISVQIISRIGMPRTGDNVLDELQKL